MKTSAVVKHSFFYLIITILVGICITLLNKIDNVVQERVSGIPEWLFPMVPAIIVVSIGYFVWKRMRESDLLKYEFITVVTHKFRGPLTQIRWAAESAAPLVPEQAKSAIVDIQNANFRLIEMTNLLVRVSDSDNVQYEYNSKPIHFGQVVQDLIPEYTTRAQVKDITLTYSGKSDRIIQGDETKIKFVIQILLDNAISYTQKGGKIGVELQDVSDTSVVLRVTDNGIGMSKEDAAHLFEKFWRSKGALSADVDGMGIGLFMAQKIVGRHGGKMWVTSEGLTEGSSFFVKLG